MYGGQSLRYMRAQARVLHVRITRNDRPGWLPLTVEHPRFYAFHRTAYLITRDNVGKGGVVRTCVRAFPSPPPISPLLSNE